MFTLTGLSSQQLCPPSALLPSSPLPTPPFSQPRSLSHLTCLPCPGREISSWSTSALLSRAAAYAPPSSASSHHDFVLVPFRPCFVVSGSKPRPPSPSHSVAIVHAQGASNSSFNDSIEQYGARLVRCTPLHGQQRGFTEQPRSHRRTPTPANRPEETARGTEGCSEKQPHSERHEVSTVKTWVVVCHQLRIDWCEGCGSILAHKAAGLLRPPLPVAVALPSSSLRSGAAEVWRPLRWRWDDGRLGGVEG